MSRFLLAAELEFHESVRSFMLRTLEMNAALPHTQVELQNIARMTKFIPEFCQLTGRSVDQMMRRGGQITTKSGRHVQYGSSTVHRDHIERSIRAVCPMCAREGINDSAWWEIQLCKACPFHGCQMVDRCNHCDKPLRWDTASYRSCSCGASFSSLTTEPADGISIRMARLIADAVKVSISGSASYPRRLTIDWLLLLVGFIEKVLLPNVGALLGASSVTVTSWTSTVASVHMLEDRMYGNYLRESLFLHASKKPMRLRHALEGQHTKADFALLFGDVLNDMTLHRSLWEICEAVAAPEFIQVPLLRERDRIQASSIRLAAARERREKLLSIRKKQVVYDKRPPTWRTYVHASGNTDGRH